MRPGKEVGFAEDDAVGVGVVDQGLTVGEWLSECARGSALARSVTVPVDNMRIAICEELL